MTRSGPKNIVASVQARLVARSRELAVEHQLTLARYGGERFLYRLSRSEFANRFVLKGAALLLIWLGEAIRPTKDVDLLGLGDTSAEALERVFMALCAVDAPEDGLSFLADSVRVETSIAEKTEAMVHLALANSRMKDFFDIHRLAETRTFDGDTMRLAVAATFARRGIEIPDERPLALTSAFAEDAQKKVQWTAFVRRTRRPDLHDLSTVVATLDRFLWPVLQAAARREPWTHRWSNGGPWQGAQT